MKSRILTLALILLASTVIVAEDAPEEAKIRDSIPLGGNFRPNPKVGAFVVVGHGARIIVSKDDGQTWKQAFFAAPGADHGPWATKSVAYTNGVFAVPVGWGGPTIFLASDDAVNWRHLTSGAAKLPDAKGNPRLMTGTWGLAGGQGVFVSSGYMTFSATANLGKSFTSFGMWGRFKDDPRGKMNTHHIGTVYCGDASGRFLAQYRKRRVLALWKTLRFVREHPVKSLQEVDSMSLNKQVELEDANVAASVKYAREELDL